MNTVKTAFIFLFIAFFPLFSKEKPMEMIYKDAIVYTGYTKYIFTDPKTKKDWELDVPSDEVKKFSIPKTLLENPEEVEGLVGANPKMIGKKFIITDLKNGGKKVTLKKN